MSIKVWLLLVSRAREEWLLLTECLVVQVIKLLTNGEDVLSLLLNHILTFAIGRIENGREPLGHWHSLCSRFLRSLGANLGAFGVSTGRGVVINERRSQSNVTFPWNNLLILFSVKVFMIVDLFLIIDLLNKS